MRMKEATNYVPLEHQGKMQMTIFWVRKMQLILYTAQQKFSTDFIFVLILVRTRNNFFEVINKCGNP